ncbi:MAG: hypothetical protein HY597_04295 [Candidatus Omnitrophica bacterium]|nr:hypothetical protein [Candidatus Omnitrophota bacterium]
MHNGQTVVEYATLLAVVVAVFLSMNAYVERSVRAGLKGVEGELNLSIVPTPPLQTIIQDPINPDPVVPPGCHIEVKKGKKVVVCG